MQNRLRLVLDPVFRVFGICLRILLLSLDLGDSIHRAPQYIDKKVDQTEKQRYI
jgi:hypothetical protein